MSFLQTYLDYIRWFVLNTKPNSNNILKLIACERLDSLWFDYQYGIYRILPSKQHTLLLNYYFMGALQIIVCLEPGTVGTDPQYVSLKRNMYKITTLLEKLNNTMKVED